MTTMTTTGDGAAMDDMLPQQDRILFGTKTLDISDQLKECVEDALKDGVKSLPRVPHQDALLDLLSKVYSRNVDVLEAYMGRNIFSIQSLPATRRKNVVEAFVTNKLPNIPNVLLDDKENARPAASSIIIQYPNADEIPTPEAMISLDESLKDLRTKLADAKLRRKKLVSKGEALALVTVPQVTDASIISNTVSKLIHDKETLDDLTVRAQELVAKMDDDKRSRPDHDEDAVLVPKKPKLGMEEAYEKERQTIAASTEGVQNVMSFLQKQEQQQ